MSDSRDKKIWEWMGCINVSLAHKGRLQATMIPRWLQPFCVTQTSPFILPQLDDLNILHEIVGKLDGNQYRLYDYWLRDLVWETLTLKEKEKQRWLMNNGETLVYRRKLQDPTTQQRLTALRKVIGGE